MYCKNFSTLNGCSKCNIPLSNTNIITNLDTEAIFHITSKILNTVNNNYVHNGKVISYDESLVSCSGKITIYTSKVLSKDTLNIEKDNFLAFIHLLLQERIDEIFNSFITIYLCIVLYTLIIDKHRQKGTLASRVEHKKDIDKCIEVGLFLRYVIHELFNFD